MLLKKLITFSRGNPLFTKTLLRLSLSLLVLLSLNHMVEYGKLFSIINKIPLHGALIIVSLYTLSQVLSAYKWKMILDIAGLFRSFIEVVKIYFLGMLINFIGLGTVGGDIARAMALNPKKDQVALSFGSVLVDRIHGLATLLLVGTLAIIAYRPNIFEPYGVYFSYFFFPLTLISILFPKSLLMLLPQLKGKAGTIIEQIKLSIPKKKDAIVKITLVSIILHLLQIAIIVYISKLLKLPLTPSYLLCTIPFVNIASSLPLSWNGLGVREAMYIFFFVSQGVTEEESVAFGALWLFAVTLTSSLFGFIALQFVSSKSKNSINAKVIE